MTDRAAPAASPPPLTSTVAKAGLAASRYSGFASRLIVSLVRNWVTRNGPVPIGPKFWSVQVGAFTPLQASNWAFCRIGDCDPTKAENGSARGESKVTLTVCGSTASTAVMPSNLASCAQPPSGSMQYSAVKTTSSAVSGVPSDHFTSSARFQVTEVRSSAMPPFSSDGISVTRRA